MKSSPFGESPLTQDLGEQLDRLGKTLTQHLPKLLPALVGLLVLLWLFRRDEKQQECCVVLEMVFLCWRCW